MENTKFINTLFTKRYLVQPKKGFYFVTFTCSLMTNTVGQNMYRVVNDIQFYSTSVGVFESVLIYVTCTKHNLIFFVKIIA
jgi:hypothetical protein